MAVQLPTGVTDVQTSTTPSATFTGLVAGQTYDVRIVAISGSLRSDSRSDSFTVAAEGDSVQLCQNGGGVGGGGLCVCVCVCVCLCV